MLYPSTIKEKERLRVIEQYLDPNLTPLDPTIDIGKRNLKRVDLEVIA